MGRAPRCSKAGLNRSAWTAEEDDILCKYIYAHGEGNWRSLAANAGLKRCEKSCRLRWLNYLRPNIKRGSFTEEEDDLIIRLHNLLGNRWSLIAGRLPGRTDNEIKNYWNTHLGKIQQTDSNAKMKTQKMWRPQPRKRRTQIALPMSHSYEAPSALQVISPKPLNPIENKCESEGSEQKEPDADGFSSCRSSLAWFTQTEEDFLDVEGLFDSYCYDYDRLFPYLNY
eukprot:TRINITY_DN357_c0_g1_i4.p1 TRINITY_DN357_c0_g1~~TRINITY_DN357_c0_g1_i4.p1  ORF type:complete len:226 (+),score=15.02 TRINITY_DN357_c0_g1_i4:358-1035(+)